MDEYRTARRVLMVDVSGERVRRRLRLGWMDVVKMALGSRGIMAKKHRKQWRALVHM